ncbi:unnamed protein product [Alternaria burnsii]|nr:unnamed protein product [Alternaria burnsii]
MVTLIASSSHGACTIHFQDDNIYTPNIARYASGSEADAGEEVYGCENIHSSERKPKVRINPSIMDEARPYARQDKGGEACVG